MKISAKLIDAIKDLTKAIAKTDDVPGVSRELDTSGCEKCSCGLKQQLQAAAHTFSLIESGTAPDVDYMPRSELHKLSQDGYREATK